MIALLFESAIHVFEAAACRQRCADAARAGHRVRCVRPTKNCPQFGLFIERSEVCHLFDIHA